MENETPGKESMRIMQETKIFIISNEYRNAITKIAAENHHFLIHDPKANADQVKELLPDYEVIELNPMKHAIDYKQTGSEMVCGSFDSKRQSCIRLIQRNYL